MKAHTALPIEQAPHDTSQDRLKAPGDDGDDGDDDGDGDDSDGGDDSDDSDYSDDSDILNIF